MNKYEAEQSTNSRVPNHLMGPTFLVDIHLVHFIFNRELSDPCL